MIIHAIAREVSNASERISGQILKTPLIESHVLSEIIEGHVFLKLENEQYTGSFKARGSLNKILSLSDKEKTKELVTASTGNHGLGFARAVKLTGTKGSVFLPQSASKAKIKKLEYYPVNLIFHDGDSLSTELYARQFATENDAIWISPYNDLQILAGQGSIAVEILDQMENIDEILVTVGGGGLISGIGAFLKAYSSHTKVVSCQPYNSREMTLSLAAQKIVDQPDAKETLSDGSAGGIEPDSITFEICQQVIDHCITVTEKEIAEALRLMVYEHGKIIEGSAAVTIASLLKEKDRFKGKTVVCVICGGNIEIKKLVEILAD